MNCIARVKNKLLLIFFLLQFSFSILAIEPFRFALFTDMHISELKPHNAKDLESVIMDLNAEAGIDFVLIAGDNADLGDLESFKQIKRMLDKFKMPYYITTGNHDTNYGETGSSVFKSVFGSDKFSFVHNGVRFIGFPTSPLRRHEKAKITEVDLAYVKKECKKGKKRIPTILITHYPMLNGDISNWDDLHRIISKKNIKAILGGHYHRNVVLNYNNIPGIVNRSTQRSKHTSAGYSIYTVSDSLSVTEKLIGQSSKVWLTLPLN